MNRFTIFAAIAAFALSTAKAPAAPLPVSAFDYAPMAFSSDSISRDAGDGTMRGVVTYNVGNRTQTAEIIAPKAVPGAGKASPPGVLFVHWLGDAATTNHTEFEADAIALAKRGAVCVLLDAMWSTTVPGNGNDWFEKGRTTKTDYANSIRQVIDLRRALDLLLSENVDPKRIAYVGHDFGSMYGAVLAGVDTRPSYYVLMAGNPSFSNWYLLGKKPADVPAFVKQMEPLDPMPYLARATAKAFLFQFATHDDYITNPDAMAFAAAAPLPRGVFLYNTDHALKVPDAAADRIAWLETRLFP
jgi:pimeloyl-ACP methyl ester carboxylesterase